MQKKILFIIIINICFINIPKALKLPVKITADSAIVFDLKEDEILYEKNADKEEIMASLTKIATVYTALNHVDNIDKKITIKERDVANLSGFTQAGLKVGDKVSIKDLLYATILQSGADSSQALAYNTTNDMSKFIKLMNEDIKKLGLTKTEFYDVYGGDDKDISTAKEMAIILKNALKNKTFKKVFATNIYRMSNGLYVYNYTRPISDYYGLDSTILTGNKSGYTPEAGLLLASTGMVNNKEYLVVVCKSKVQNVRNEGHHILDSYKIYNYLKDNNYQKRTLIKKDEILKEIDVENATISKYKISLSEDITKVLNDQEYKNTKIEYNLVDKINYDIKDEESLGTITILVDDEIIYQKELFWEDKLLKKPKEEKNFYVYIGIFIFSLLIGLIIFRN